MIKFVFILFCSICFESYSQNKDLFITVDNQSSIDTLSSSNDSVSVKIFRLKLDSDESKLKFFVDDKGEIRKEISLPSGKMKIIEFIYTATRNNNPPILIRAKQKPLGISFNDILNAENFKELYEILESFENIYIINTEERCNKFLIAKKVKLLKQKADL